VTKGRRPLSGLVCPLCKKVMRAKTIQRIGSSGYAFHRTGQGGHTFNPDLARAPAPSSTVQNSETRGAGAARDPWDSGY
jgi:hypothetical protein